jgi:hypothetical protein
VRGKAKIIIELLTIHTSDLTKTVADDIQFSDAWKRATEIYKSARPVLPGRQVDDLAVVGTCRGPSSDAGLLRLRVVPTWCR